MLLTQLCVVLTLWSTTLAEKNVVQTNAENVSKDCGMDDEKSYLEEAAGHRHIKYKNGTLSSLVKCDKKREKKKDVLPFMC